MGNYLLASTLCLLVVVSEAQTTDSPVTAGDPVGQRNPSRVIVSELQLRGTVQAMFASLVKEAGLAGGVAVANQDCSHGQEGAISVPAGTSFDTALGQFVKNKAMSEGQPRDGTTPTAFLPSRAKIGHRIKLFRSKYAVSCVCSTHKYLRPFRRLDSAWRIDWH